MRRILTLIICLLALLGARAQQLTDDDIQQYEYAVYFMDNGMPDKSLEILDKLIKKYPDMPDLVYEMAYAHYIKEDYKQALKLLQRLEKMPPVHERVYQMEGNTLDMLGKSKDAIKKYKEGLKLFPTSHTIMLELGTMMLKDKKYLEALNYYEQALEVHPAYPSAYFRASQILLNSKNVKVWGLFYGEAMRVLEPNSSRSNEMAQYLGEAYQQFVTIKNDSSIGITLNSANASGTIESQYELMLSLGIAAELTKNKDKGVTLAEIIHGRESAIAAAGTAQDGHIVSLLDFQQKVKDAGHWEAYNYWLFSPAFENEAQEWLKDNEEKMDEFIEWYKSHPFMPTIERPTHRLMKGTPVAALNDLPDILALSTAEGCRQHTLRAQQCAHYWLSTPDGESPDKLRAGLFAFTWSMNTDEYQFVGGTPMLNSFLHDATLTDSISPNLNLLTAYFMASVDYAIDHGVKKTDAEMHYQAILAVLAYYEANEQRFVPLQALTDALIARDEGRLRQLTDADLPEQ